MVVVAITSSAHYAHDCQGSTTVLDVNDPVVAGKGEGKCSKRFGGPGEIRTHDLFHAI
jgi:hypothetical protein